MWTTIMALVLDVRCFSTASASKHRVFGFISANTGFPPAKKTEATVAENVFVGTTTSSSFPMPQHLRAISRALVPEFTATECFAS